MARRGNPPIDITGQKFHRWTVVKRTDSSPKGQAQWLCRCDCGTEKVLKSIVIRRGISKSCGCYKIEVLKERSVTHGNTQNRQLSPTYRTWASMLNRCSNPKNDDYTQYGGRGIKVCKEWQHFQNFLADMGERPKGRHSIDRIDNDSDYTPENCRWATDNQQARNRSNNHLVTLGGKTLTLTGWSEVLGIRQSTIRRRLRVGWSPEEALTTPLGKSSKYRQRSDDS